MSLVSGINELPSYCLTRRLPERSLGLATSAPGSVINEHFKSVSPALRLHEQTLADQGRQRALPSVDGINELGSVASNKYLYMSAAQLTRHCDTRYHLAVASTSVGQWHQ